MKNILSFLMIMIAVVVNTSCAETSYTEERSNAREAAKATFNLAPIDPNQENEHIQYYLPSGFKVEREKPNNILLKSRRQEYILFYNQHESDQSEVIYDTAISQIDYDVNDTFYHDDRFGFLLMTPLNDETVEITVGIGGVKITTQSKVSKITDEAKKMMFIANSVEVK
ncbi:hypothetical protein [Cytobacillus horneckiae]|uniref:hypothetical protein n=1 Tax=Cytobacillus horneckiae TaxID=549687 RepID=UPI003D9A4C60